MNRKDQVPFVLFHFRHSGGRLRDDELSTFSRVALNEGLPLQDIGFFRGSANEPMTIGEVFEIRGKLKAFRDQVLRKCDELRRLKNDDAAAEVADLTTAVRVAERAIASCNGQLEAYEEMRGPVLGSLPGDGTGSIDGAPYRRANVRMAGAGVEVLHDPRTGAELRIARKPGEFRQLFVERDQALAQAYESGQFDMADFVRAVAGMRSSDIARRALSVGTDSAGGYTVPTVLMPEVFDAMAPVSSLLSAGAGVVQREDLTDGAKSYNWAAVQTLPTAAWRAEAGNLNVSDPVFRNVQAIPRSLSFMFKVSRELLADSLNLREAINVIMAQAFAKELDRAGLRGSGSGAEPRGLLNTSGVQSVANGANGASLATTKWQNLLDAVKAILQADGPLPSSAIMSPRSLIGFSSLADSTGQPLERPSVLRDLRFISTSQVPINLTVGTSTDCTELYLGEFSKMFFFIRENPSLQLLNERYADTGEVGFACHVRADVVVPYPAAFGVVTGVRP